MKVEVSFQLIPFDIHPVVVSGCIARISRQRKQCRGVFWGM
jgi:hypothetical protein